jgi:hypothetical protein
LLLTFRELAGLSSATTQRGDSGWVSFALSAPILGWIDSILPIVRVKSIISICQIDIFNKDQEHDWKNRGGLPSMVQGLFFWDPISKFHENGKGKEHDSANHKPPNEYFFIFRLDQSGEERFPVILARPKDSVQAPKRG